MKMRPMIKRVGVIGLAVLLFSPSALGQPSDLSIQTFKLRQDLSSYIMNDLCRERCPVFQKQVLYAFCGNLERTIELADEAANKAIVQSALQKYEEEKSIPLDGRDKFAAVGHVVSMMIMYKTGYHAALDNFVKDEDKEVVCQNLERP